MNTKIANALVETLTAFFSTNCKVFPPDIHNDSVSFEIPLSAYDDQNIVVIVEQGLDHTVLHDGGYVVNYLDNHDILVHSKQKKYAIYSRFYEDLARKHGFQFSKKYRRFEMQINPEEGQKALVFAECLIALSFLVMTKWAGLKTYSPIELQRLSGVKLTLSAAFPEIQVAPGLLPNVMDRPAPQTWGLTLKVLHQERRGCVHYLRGPDWTHLLRGAIVLNTFSQNSERWFNSEAGCYFGVYGGPPELFDDTNKTLKEIGNGHPALLIPFDDPEQLVTEVSARLQIPTRDGWRQILQLQQATHDENILNARTQDAGTARPSDSRDMLLADVRSKTASEHDLIEDILSPGFEAAMLRLVGETEYRSEFVFDPLETYGLPFAQYVLAELKERPGKILVSRFNQIADAFLEYYSNDAKSTDILDREIAEVECKG